MAGTITIPKFSGHHFLSVGVKMIEKCRIFIQGLYFSREEDSILNYIKRSIKEGDTVIDIGTRELKYLYFIKKQLKSSGKIIAFELQPNLYHRLKHLVKILDWKNIDIEIPKFNHTQFLHVVSIAGDAARNIAKHESLNKRPNVLTKNMLVYNSNVQTLDDYCINRNIQPCFLKIDAEGNELGILRGAITILKNYKPKILLRCDQRVAGKQKVMATFQFLAQLNYTGHFILDTIRIPLVNFDFNVYQNECNDFYCTEFMFA